MYAYYCLQYVSNAPFWHIGEVFCSGRGSFLALSSAGHKGARVYARRKLGPRPGSEARALSVRSRAIWQVIAGSLSAEREPTSPTETPKIRKKKKRLHFSAAVSQIPQQPSQDRQSRHYSRATSVSLCQPRTVVRLVCS